MPKRLAAAVLAALVSTAALAADPAPEAKPDPAAASTTNAKGKQDPATPAKKTAGNKGAAKPAEGKRAPIKYEGC
jgi:hypothetical protein